MGSSITLKSPKSRRKEGGVKGAGVSSLTNFLSRWSGYEWKSPGWEMSRNQREIDLWYCAVAWARWQPWLKSQQGEEAKLASSPEETDHKNMQDEGDWTFTSTQSRSRIPLFDPEVSLTNRYEALRMEREEGVDSDSDLETGNPIKLVQPRAQVGNSATKKSKDS